jgi:hypothetical protein
MRKLSLILALASLMICVACGAGGSGNSGGFGGGGTSGNFSNSSLKGNYAYEIVGFDITDNAPYREAGVFVADGSGNITGGEDDFAEGSNVVSNTVASVTGAYTVSNDGTGTVTLSFNNGGGLQLAVSVVSAPTIYLAMSTVDPLGTTGGQGLSVNGTGFAVPQTTSSFGQPSGTFVFRSQSLNTALGGLTPTADVGVFTVAGGTISSGAEDQIAFGQSDTQLNITGGTFNTPDSFGRGTGSYTDSNSHTTSFYYYVVDNDHIHFFSSLSGVIGLGRAVAQTGTTFSGSYVFGSKGDDSAFLGGVNTAGQFTASGGAITSGGSFDTVQDGGTPLNGSYSGGTYTVANNGRVTLTLNPSSGSPIQEVYWVVSPSTAFFLTNDATKVETGTATSQTVTSFTNSSVSGTFGFASDGFDSTDLLDQVGYLHWDGAGNLAISEFQNVSGNQQTSGILKGTYTMGANGRAVGSIANVSGSLIVYLASGTEGYIIQTDSGFEVDGMMGTAQ